MGCPAQSKTVIVPRAHDVGGFEVHRALPATEKQMVGPFIFFDQMGPGEFLTGRGLDVRPHPHIGLATVTYLFDGSILHRDSLGTQLPIVPGDVNWMTAGQRHRPLGTHGHRAAGPQRTGCSASSPGSRCRRRWRRPRRHLPITTRRRCRCWRMAGVRLRLIAGDGWGLRSPVETFWPLFYADASLAPGAALPMPDQHEERGVYVVQGTVDVAGTRFEAGRMLLFRAGDRLAVHGRAAGRPAAAAGRRGDGRAAPHLLELRVVVAGADRAGQGGLESAAASAQSPATRQEFIPLPEQLEDPEASRSPRRCLTQRPGEATSTQRSERS